MLRNQLETCMKEKKSRKPQQRRQKIQRKPNRNFRNEKQQQNNRNNSLDWLNIGRMNMTEESTDETEDRKTENIWIEQQKENEHSLKNLWDNNKRSKICIISLRKKGERVQD